MNEHDAGWFSPIGKALKGLVIETSEETVEETSAEPRSTLSAPALVVDPQIVTRLKDALKSAGTNSLATVLDLYASMVEEIPDSATRLRASFKIARKQGVTEEKVAKDFDALREVLDQKEQAFERDVQAQMQAAVGSRRDNVEKIRAVVAEKQAAVAKLQQEIAAASAAEHAAETEIAAEEQHIASVRAVFAASLAQVRAEISAQESMFGKVK